MNLQTTLDILGWGGSLLVLYAFYLLNRHKLTANSSFYQWLNLIGSFFLGLNSLYYKAYPSVSINFFWILITIYGFIKIKERKKQALRPKTIKG